MAPRLRDDLVAATVEEAGVTYVDLTDPTTGINFRFYDFEYDLAKQLTGQPLEDVVAWASAAYQLELTTEALDQFIDKLAGLGFLAGGEAEGGAQPQEISPASASSSSGPFGKPSPSVVAGRPEEAVELTSSPMFVEGIGDAGREAIGAAIDAIGESRPTAGTPLEAVEPEMELSASALLDEGSSAEGLAIDGLSIEGLSPAGSSTEVSSAPHPVSPFPLAAPAPSAHLAATPAKLAEDHATEFQLREPGAAANGKTRADEKGDVPSEPAVEQRNDGKSGLFAKPRTLHGISLAPLTPLTPVAPPPADGGAPPLPRLQVTAPPLPPLTSEAIAGGARRASALDAKASGPGAPTPATTEETPLAAIAQAIAAEVTAPNRAMPSGSLEASEPSSGVIAAGDVSPNSASWAKALTDEVEKPTSVAASIERRQPPAPEVVVMPPVAEPAAHLPRRKAPLIVGLLLAGGVAAAVAFALRPEKQTAPVTASAPAVHVIAPQPTTYYQWYAPSGTVVAGKDDELGFPVGGKVQDVMPPGTTFSAGEPVARLVGVAVRELNVNRVRARVAFFEQLRDSSRAAGNEPAARQAEANVVARSRELAAAQTALAELEIRPKAAGQIGQVLVERGALVRAGTPAIRIRAAGPRATFPLPPDAQAKARALGFCRLETVPGSGATDGGATEKGARAVDCNFPPLPPGAAPVDGPLTVDVVGAPDLAPGTAVNLASARFDGVFPLPKTAVVHDENGGSTGGAAGAARAVDHVWVVSAGGDSAEKRAVEVASTVEALALISHGLEAGDSVIVDPPADLRAGATISVVH
jgi:multidrug efflux pump subunit AcrA (membrane-fusion protein)